MTDKVEVEVTGTSILRQMLRSLHAKTNLSLLARDLHTTVGTLEDFVSGKSVPPPELLQKLATHLHAGQAEYVVEANALRSTNKNPPRPLGKAPAPLDPAGLPVYSGGPPPLMTAAVPGLRPVPPRIRPGWTC